MQARYRAAIPGLIVLMAMSVCATAQSLEASRVARDQAKADLIKAQDAFDRADEAYIKALSGAASLATAAVPPSPTPSAASGRPAGSPASTPAEVLPLEVTFAINGTGALEVSPFDFRARLIVDERPFEWTEHASGSKQTAPSATRSLTYEVQHDAKSEPIRPEWRTICQGSLPLKRRTTVEIAIGRSMICTPR